MYSKRLNTTLNTTQIFYYLSLCIFLASLLYMIYPSPYKRNVSYLNFVDTWNISLYDYGEGFVCTVAPFGWTAAIGGNWAYLYSSNSSDDAACDPPSSQLAYKLNIKTGEVTNSCIIPERELMKKVSKVATSIPLVTLPESYFDKTLDFISIIDYLYYEKQVI